MTTATLPAIAALLDVTRYDRAPELSLTEQQALARFALTHRDRDLVLVEAEQEGLLTRLFLPLHDASARIEGDDFPKRQSIFLLMRTCQCLGTSFWAWDDATWIEVLGTSQETFFRYHSPGNPTHLRQYTIALAYLFVYANRNWGHPHIK